MHEIVLVRAPSHSKTFTTIPTDNLNYKLPEVYVFMHLKSPCEKNVRPSARNWQDLQ